LHRHEARNALGLLATRSLLELERLLGDLTRRGELAQIQD